jgi:hypothetical protein
MLAIVNVIVYYYLDIHKMIVLSINYTEHMIYKKNIYIRFIILHVVLIYFVNYYCRIVIITILIIF